MSKSVVQTSVQLSEAKLQELAEDPNNIVYRLQDDKEKPAENILTAQETRKMVQQIRYRARVLHEELPTWSVKQIQNKLCREKEEWAALARNDSWNRLWQKVSDFNAPPHEIKHVMHIIDVMEREEKKEITHEEAKQLVTFYLQQNVGKKLPKRKEKA